MTTGQPDSEHYSWFVARGLVEVWREAGEIRLRSSHDAPKDAPVCVLTKEDALEIATLLYHLAHGTENRQPEAPR